MDKEFMNLEIIKAIITALGLLFFLGCATANASVFLKWALKKKSGSNIPLIGGLAGCIACLVSPWPLLHPFWWPPFILDASYIMMALGIGKVIVNYKSSKKDN